MRVAIVSESFLPQVNGVTNSVLRVCEQLTRQGHEALVIAPGPGPAEWSGVPVVRTPSCPVPGYRDFRVALLFPAMTAALHEFGPDVVHLASPAVLGAQGATAAAQLGIPCWRCTGPTWRPTPAATGWAWPSRWCGAGWSGCTRPQRGPWPPAAVGGLQDRYRTLELLEALATV